MSENPEQHAIEGWGSKSAELEHECQKLRAALREALNGWEQWYINYPDPIDQKRIAALRKEFLE